MLILFVVRKKALAKGFFVVPEIFNFQCAILYIGYNCFLLAAQDLSSNRTYINNNIDKIDYPSYKEKGYFVGSGAIESANKVIVQRRLKQAGMRWSVSGAQAVLSLRAKAESRLWVSEVKALIAA
jgi:hypothetical protein